MVGKDVLGVGGAALTLAQHQNEETKAQAQWENHRSRRKELRKDADRDNHPMGGLGGSLYMSTPVMLSQAHMTGQEATLIMVRKSRWKLDSDHCETVSANSLERVGAGVLHIIGLCVTPSISLKFIITFFRAGS